MNTKLINNNAIVFCVSDEYLFSLACAIDSLRINSPYTYENSDLILIDHGNFSPTNIFALRNICPKIQLYKNKLSDKFNPLFNHKRSAKYFGIPIYKLNILNLLNSYEKILYLDSDIYIAKDISALFDIEAPIAWRDVKIWSPTAVIGKCFSNKGIKIHAPNDGVLLFNKSILNYDLSDEYILSAFDKIKDLQRGATLEVLLGYICADKCIDVAQIDYIYNIAAGVNNPNETIVHFCDPNPVTKPWLSTLSLLRYPQWGLSYNKWIKFGGKPFAPDGVWSNSLTRTSSYCNIWKDLFNKIDFYKLQPIKANFDFSKNSIIFLLNGLKNVVSYKVTIKDRNFNVSLYIDDISIITNSLSESLAGLKTDFTVISDEKRYIYQITTSCDMVNLYLHKLYNTTYSYFKNCEKLQLK